MTDTPSNTATVCATCGAMLHGRFCAQCGERRLAPDKHSVRRFVADTIQDLTNLDARFYRSFALLFRRPGLLTREYLAGRQVRYLRPLQLFLMANLLYFVVQPFTSYTGYNTPLRSQIEQQPYSEPLHIAERVERRVAERDVPFEQYETAFDTRSSFHARSLIIAMVPIFAFCSALVLADRRRPLVEHVVFATHFYAWLLVFIGSFFLLAWSWLLPLQRGVVRALSDASLALGSVVGAFLFEWITFVLIIPYTYFALRRVFGGGREEMIARAFALTVLSIGVMLVFRLLLFWVTFLSA